MISNSDKQGQSSKQTLFSIPDPKVRHSFEYSHGLRSSRQSRGQSVGILSGEDDDDIATATITDADSERDIATEDDEDEIRSTTSRRRLRRRKVPRFDSSQGTHRQKHLRHIYDLLMLSISRGDAKRAYRSLRVLLHAHEWSAVELWRHALQVTTMIAAENSERQIGMRTEEDRMMNEQKIAQKRLVFMRQLNKTRASALQVDLLLEMIPEMLILGLEEQAMEEIDLLITTYPFRLEPLLHLYSAMLYLIITERSLEAADIENDLHRIRFGQNVTSIDKELAFIPKVLLIYRLRGHESAISQLQRIEQKFEMVLNVGKAPSKRGRRDVRSASQSRSRSRSHSVSQSRSRSRSHSVSQSRYTSVGDASNSESEAESRGRRKRGRRRRGDYDEEDEGEDEGIAPILVATAERDDVRVMNDGWARAMARAYLAIIKSPISFS